jgi:hypothetical protein
MLVQELVLGESDTIIPHCAAVLPLGCRPALTEYLNILEEKDYFEQIILFGPGLSTDKQRALQPRFRIVATRLKEFLQNPATPSDMPPPDADLFWAWVKEMPRQHGVQCQQPGCTDTAISLSVNCPKHHYEQVKHRLPPE